MKYNKYLSQSKNYKGKSKGAFSMIFDTIKDELANNPDIKYIMDMFKDEGTDKSGGTYTYGDSYSNEYEAYNLDSYENDSKKNTKNNSKKKENIKKKEVSNESKKDGSNANLSRKYSTINDTNEYVMKRVKELKEKSKNSAIYTLDNDKDYFKPYKIDKNDMYFKPFKAEYITFDEKKKMESIQSKKMY